MLYDTSGHLIAQALTDADKGFDRHTGTEEQIFELEEIKMSTWGDACVLDVLSAHRHLFPSFSAWSTGSQGMRIEEKIRHFSILQEILRSK